MNEEEEMMDWFGCYSSRWQGEIVPEAFSHPAKFARGLIWRIYAHALERGYLKPGDWVADPFAGTGLGAADALTLGLNWFGAELERNFVDMGTGCDCTGISKDDWVRCFGRWKRFAHRDGRHWCPRCLAEAGQIIKERKAPEPDQAQAKRRARMRELMAQTGRKVDFSLYVPIPFPESRERQTVRAARLFGTEALATSYKRNSGKIPHTEPHRYMGNLDLFARHAKNGARAVLVQGDSRRLVEVLEGARVEGMIASPPYSKSHIGAEDNPYTDVPGGRLGSAKTGHLVGNDNYGTDPAQLGNMPTGEPPQAVIGSPPHSVTGLGHDAGHPRLDAAEDARREAEGCGRRPAYGESDGQLAAMREGDVDAVISSPPWASTEGSHSAAKFKDPEGSAERRAEGYRTGKLKGHYASKEAILRAMQKANQSTYGTSDGQLAALPEGEPPQVDGLVASPPYEVSMTREEEAKDYPGGTQVTKRYQRSYGKNPDNLGNISQDTFWSAAKTILDQCHAVLAPGGVAIFVTKRFVRNKQIVEFSQQWADLCQSCGFELVEWIKAWLVEERGTQYDLGGEAHTKMVKRFSFFRRLHAQKYPHLTIEWEDVLIFRKGAA